MPSYEISPLALDDLLDIQEFISRDHPTAAEHLIDNFFAAFDRLAEWPSTGHSRIDLTRRDVLFWPVGSYLIIYRENRNLAEIQIVSVLHAARDLLSILPNR
jgi:plasmid stabilization system protein ParE